ncbi:hypothetical protein [Streptomyces sp. NPDC005538]|uniref:hypothetical protein n=1 Tax=Streptomyces sp. NPDC005538 TaxID=3157043 RepID=UPI0033AC883B
MSAETPSPGPAFTQVRLIGPPAEVDRLMALLSSGAEVIFDDPSQPDARGEVERTAQVVTHPSPRPPSPDHGMSVTVQAVLETESGAFPRLPSGAAAQEVEESVTQALQAMPRIRLESLRVVSAWGLPAPRE